MTRLPRALRPWNLAIVFFLSSTAGLAACQSGGAGTPAAAGDTFWMAPNGSEVVLKLSTTRPTVPF
jgi:hypothetical protein